MISDSSAFRSPAYWALALALVFVAPAVRGTPLTAEQISVPSPSAAGRTRTTPESNTVGSSVIRGRVLSASDARPIRRAQVRLSSADSREVRIAATDEEGYYVFKDLPSGRYTLFVSKRGYVSIGFGQMRPREAGRPVDLARNQELRDVNFSLPRGSVIAVRVTDEFGEPLPNAEVQLFQSRFVQGSRTLAQVPAGSVLTQTNDLGEARLYGLSPGEYYVAARMRERIVLGADAGPLSYATTFYPGTASGSEAERLILGIGQEVNIAFPLVFGRSATISGFVRMADGSVPPKASIMLSQHAGSGVAATSVTSDVNGLFVFTNVMPGEYHVAVALSQRAGSTGEYASLPIRVDGNDISGVSIITSPMAIVRGRLVVEASDTAIVPVGTIQLIAASDRPGALSPRWTWNEDGTFEVSGLTGERVFRMDPRTPGWFLKSVVHNGVDVTDTAIDFDKVKELTDMEVTVTQARSSLSGTVVGPGDDLTTEYVVVAMPEDEKQWTPHTRRIATARPDQAGRFSLLGLPAGDYTIVAVEYAESGEERNPDFLRRVGPLGTRVTIRESGSHTVKLRLAGR